MACDYSPFYLMDSNLEFRVHETLLLAVEMAKDKYPHLSNQIEEVERLYKARLESFTGSQNKPVTHIAYQEKKV